MLLTACEQHYNLYTCHLAVILDLWTANTVLHNNSITNVSRRRHNHCFWPCCPGMKRVAYLKEHQTRNATADIDSTLWSF